MSKIIFVVDMVKGFCEKGALADPDIKTNILENIKELIDKIKPTKENLVFFADTHTETDPELAVFPPHCMKGTEEAEVIEELAGYDYIMYEKNTTNGFLTNCVVENSHLANAIKDPNTEYIITGCCSDICVLTFALSLKTYLNSRNGGKVVVPFNCMDTYHIPGNHNRTEYNKMAKQLMEVQGIEVPYKYKFD